MSSSQQREVKGGPPNQSRSSSYRTERANGTNLTRNTDIVPPKPTRQVPTRGGHPAQYSNRPAQPRQQNTALQSSTRGPASFPTPSTSRGIFKRAQEENHRDFSDKSRPDDFTFKNVAATRPRGTPRAPISPPTTRRERPPPPPTATKNAAPLVLEPTIPKKYSSSFRSDTASSRMRGVANEPQTVSSTVPVAPRAHSNSSLSATGLDSRPSKRRHIRFEFIPTADVQEIIARAVEMYNPEEIGVDDKGGYILFPATPAGKLDQTRCNDSETVQSLLRKLRRDQLQSVEDQLPGTNESTPTKVVAELRKDKIQPSPASSTSSDNIVVTQRPKTAVPSVIPTTSFPSHASKNAHQKGYPNLSNSSKQTFSVPLNDVDNSRPSSSGSAPRRILRQDRDDTSSCVSGSSSRTKANCHKCSSIGGQLFLCSTCPRRYHRQCLPLDTSPEDIDQSWQCEFCKRKKIPPKPRKKNDSGSSSAISTEREESLRDQKDQVHSEQNRNTLNAGVRTAKGIASASADAVLATQVSITNAVAPPPAIPHALNETPASKNRYLPLTEPTAKGKQPSEDNRMASKAGRTTPITQHANAAKSSRNKASPPLLTSAADFLKQSEADELVESSFTKDVTTPGHVESAISVPVPPKPLLKRSRESLTLYQVIAGEPVERQGSRDVSPQDRARSSRDMMPPGAGQPGIESGDTADLPPAVSEVIGRDDVHEASKATVKPTGEQRSTKTAKHNETNGSASNKSQAELSTPAPVLPPTESNGDASAGATSPAKELPLTAVSSAADSASTSIFTAPWAQVDVVRASWDIRPSSWPDDDKAPLRYLHKHTLALAQRDLNSAVALIDALEPEEKDTLSTMLYAMAMKESSTIQSTRDSLDPLLHWFNHDTRDKIYWNPWTSVSMVLLYGLFHTRALSQQFLHSLKEINLREFSFEEVWPLLHDEFQKDKADGQERDIAQLVLQQLKDRQSREHEQRLQDQRRRDELSAQRPTLQKDSAVKPGSKRSLPTAALKCTVCKQVKVARLPSRQPVCTKCKSKPDGTSTPLRFSSAPQVDTVGVKVPTKGLEDDATNQNSNTGHGKPTAVASARRSKTPTPADADLQESSTVKSPRRPNPPVQRMGTPMPGLPPADTGHENTVMIETVRMSPSDPPKTPSQRPDTPVLPPAAAGTNHEDNVASARRSKTPVKRQKIPVPELATADAGHEGKLTGPPAHVPNRHGLRPRTPPRDPKSPVRRSEKSVPEPAATGTDGNEESTIAVTAPPRPKTPVSRRKTPVPNLSANDDEEETIVVSPRKIPAKIPLAVDRIHENAISGPLPDRPKTPTQRLTTPPVLRPRTPTQRPTTSVQQILTVNTDRQEEIVGPPNRRSKTPGDMPPAVDHGHKDTTSGPRLGHPLTPVLRSRTPTRRSNSPEKGTKTPPVKRPKTPVRQSVAADTNIEQTVELPTKLGPSAVGLLEAVSRSKPPAAPEGPYDTAGVTMHSTTSVTWRRTAAKQPVTTRAVELAPEKSAVVNVEPKQAFADAEEVAPGNQADPVMPAKMSSTASVPQKRKQRYCSNDIFDLGDGNDRPLYTMWKLLSMALCAAPDHRARATEITKWISDNIPGYETGEWKRNVSANLTLNVQGKLGRQICSDVPVQHLGKRGGKIYELLPGLDFKLMQWDAVFQVPFMNPSPLSPGSISDSAEISEPWIGGQGSSKRRRLNHSEKQQDGGFLENLANKMKQTRIALSDYFMYWAFGADDPLAPTASSLDSDLDSTRLDNLDAQVYRQIIPRDAETHMLRIHRGSWKLRACTAFAIFGKDGMGNGRFVEGLLTLSLHDIALPEALDLLHRGQLQRRSQGTADGQPRDKDWVPWDVETYALPQICQAQDCQPCERLRGKVERRPGSSGKDAAAKTSSASSGVTSDDDMDIEDECQSEQRTSIEQSLEEVPLAKAQQGLEISKSTTPRAPSFSPMEEHPDRSVPRTVDEEQEEEDLYGVTDNEMDAEDAEDAGDADADADAMEIEQMNHSPATASDRPSPIPEDVIRDSDHLPEEDLYGCTDHEMDAEDADVMEIEHVHNSGLVAASSRTSTVADDDDIRTPDPVEEDLVEEQPEEDQTDLVNFIRQEEAQAVWSEKSLFGAWPELHPDNYFDAEAKIAEIAKRPKRKEMFGKRTLGEVDMSFLRDSRELLEENPAIRWDPIRTRQQGEYTVKSCDTIKEFFGLPEEDLVMFIDKKEICFKHPGGRSRTVYRTGDRLEELE